MWLCKILLWYFHAMRISWEFAFHNLQRSHWVRRIWRPTQGQQAEDTKVFFVLFCFNPHTLIPNFVVQCVLWNWPALLRLCDEYWKYHSSTLLMAPPNTISKLMHVRSQWRMTSVTSTYEVRTCRGENTHQVSLSQSSHLPAVPGEVPAVVRKSFFPHRPKLERCLLTSRRSQTQTLKLRLRLALHSAHIVLCDQEQEMFCLLTQSPPCERRWECHHRFYVRCWTHRTNRRRHLRPKHRVADADHHCYWRRCHQHFPGANVLWYGPSPATLRCSKDPVFFEHTGSGTAIWVELWKWGSRKTSRTGVDMLIFLFSTSCHETASWSCVAVADRRRSFYGDPPCRGHKPRQTSCQTTENLAKYYYHNILPWLYFVVLLQCTITVHYTQELVWYERKNTIISHCEPA